MSNEKFIYVDENNKKRILISIVVSLLLTIGVVSINIIALNILGKSNHYIDIGSLIRKNLILGVIVFFIMYIPNYILFKKVFDIEAYPEYLLVTKYYFRRTKFTVMNLKEIDSENIFLESNTEKVVVNTSDITRIESKDDFYIVYSKNKEYVVKNGERLMDLKLNI